jgi:hypothetical protein
MPRRIALLVVGVGLNITPGALGKTEPQFFGKPP